jgi:hypothetical protein
MRPAVAWSCVGENVLRVLVERLLDSQGYRIERLATLTAFRLRLRSERPEVAILDARTWLEFQPALPFVAREGMPPLRLLVVGRNEGQLATDGVDARFIPWPAPLSVLQDALKRFRADRQAAAASGRAQADVVVWGFGRHAEALVESLRQAGYHAERGSDGSGGEGPEWDGGCRVLLIDLALAAPRIKQLLRAVSRFHTPPAVLAVGRLAWEGAAWFWRVKKVGFLENPLVRQELLDTVARLSGRTAVAANLQSVEGGCSTGPNTHAARGGE